MTNEIKNPFLENANEIKWNLINSCLVGLIAFTSSILTSGEITFKGFLMGIFTFISIAILKFKNYWESQEVEYKSDWKNKLLALI